jgi:hypothetical protein
MADPVMSRAWALMALLLAKLLAAPAAAQTQPAVTGTGAWAVEPGGVAVRAAGLHLPDRAATLALVKTDEFSRKGEGLDNYAQYESDDRQLFATAYVYLPSLADAALAAYATDRAVRQRFGAAVSVAEQGVVAVAGRPGTAIRTIYVDAELEPGKRLVTAAAFATLGHWTVKLRATGPADRHTEVVAALDALIGGLRIDQPDRLATTRPIAFAAPCPAAAGPDAKVRSTKGPNADALLGGMVNDDKGVAQPVPRGFPAEGRVAACVRGAVQVGNTRADLIQPAGDGSPRVVLAALNDAGTVLEIGPAIMANKLVVRLHAIGQMETFGRIDRQPPVAQLQSWLADPKAPALALQSRAKYDAKGDVAIEINADTLSGRGRGR